MENDKIIVWTSLTILPQRIYVMRNGELIDQLHVTFEELEDTIYALVEKYQIYNVDFTGAQGYSEKFIENIKKNNTINYSNHIINVQYVPEKENN